MEKYVEKYEIESMSLDYCGQMCKGAHDSIFMGVQGTNCYCMNDITGSLLLSNRACNTRCSGDAAELCGGKGSLSLHQLKTESFTDVLAVVSGSLQGWKNGVNIISENGIECADSNNPPPGIPFLPGSAVQNRGVTVIEDHTMVVCGGQKENKQGIVFQIFITQVIILIHLYCAVKLEERKLKTLEHNVP